MEYRVCVSCIEIGSLLFYSHTYSLAVCCRRIQHPKMRIGRKNWLKIEFLYKCTEVLHGMPHLVYFNRKMIFSIHQFVLYSKQCMYASVCRCEKFGTMNDTRMCGNFDSIRFSFMMPKIVMFSHRNSIRYAFHTPNSCQCCTTTERSNYKIAIFIGNIYTNFYLVFRFSRCFHSLAHSFMYSFTAYEDKYNSQQPGEKQITYYIVLFRGAYWLNIGIYIYCDNSFSRTGTPHTDSIYISLPCQPTRQNSEAFIAIIWCSYCGLNASLKILNN